MPLPFILGGIAIALAGAGIKKGFDAKEDFDDAEYWNNKAKKIYNNSRDDLEVQRKSTKVEIENLGKLKFRIYENSIIPFINDFIKIKNLEEVTIDGEKKYSLLNKI